MTSTTSTRRYPGPWEWDVKRLAASVEIAARDRGFAEPDRIASATASARAYRLTMRKLAKLSNLDAWYTRIDVSRLREALGSRATRHGRNEFNRTIARAERKTRERAFSKLIETANGEPRFVSDPPYLVPVADLLEHEPHASVGLGDILAPYRESLPADRRHLLESYRYVDAARKVVGVGSVGTRCWIVLFTGSRSGRSALPTVQGGGAVRARGPSAERGRPETMAGAW